MPAQEPLQAAVWRMEAQTLDTTERLLGDELGPAGHAHGPAMDYDGDRNNCSEQGTGHEHTSMGKRAGAADCSAVGTYGTEWGRYSMVTHQRSSRGGAGLGF